MASSTRTKPPQKATRSKGGRRLPPKVKTGPDIPMLPVVVGALLVLLAAGLIAYNFINNKPVNVPSAAGIPCDQLEHTQTHYHAAVQIVSQGVLHPIPANIGIVLDSSGTSVTCYYWLHVHPANPDVIHIESPANDTFNLGQFFAVWNTWSTRSGGPSEPLDATHVSSFTLTPDQTLVVYIDANDGKGPQVYTGDPAKIVLKAHEVISLEITSTAFPATTPPAFNWSSTANAGL
ncbi:MAG TPA: hypothetical protein VF383_14165 [Candidatus Dormibacteraeota bacterium]